MTSKNSFFLNLMENMKRRGAVIIATAVYFLFAYPVTAALSINSTIYDTAYDPAYAMSKLQNSLWAISGLNITCIAGFAVLAALSAIQGYSYLHRRDKLDMYHSLPVGKTRRFFIIFMGGVLPFAVLYLLALVLFLLVCLLMGAAPSSGLLMHMLSGYWKNLLYFLCIYTISAAAAILTGNTVITCFAAPVLLFYESICRLVFYSLHDVFFETYVDHSVWTGLFTPVTNMMDMAGNPYSLLPASQSGHLEQILYLIACFVITFAISLLLYRKYPAESCSKSCAFPRLLPVLKFLLLVPFALLSMLMFHSLSAGGIGFSLFGLAVGLLLGHSLLEVLLDLDLHSILKHKLQLLFTSAACLLIFAVFRSDLFGYDRYLPSADTLESASWIPSAYMDALCGLYDGGSLHTYSNYPLDEMRITDTGLIRSLTEKSLNDSSNTPDDVRIIDNDNIFYVKYRLHSGKEIYRRLFLDLDTSEELLRRLYSLSEFKSGLLQLYNDQFLEDLKSFRLSMTYTGYTDMRAVEEPDFDSFCQAYLRDYEAAPYFRESGSSPVGIVELNAKLNPSGNDPAALLYNSRGMHGIYNEFYFPVYDHYANTLSWLESHGVRPEDKPQADAILSITADGYLPVLADEDPSGSSMERVRITVTDTGSIEEIAELMIPAFDAYNWQLIPASTAYRHLELNVQYQADGGTLTTTCFFPSPDALPDFLKNAVTNP